MIFPAAAADSEPAAIEPAACAIFKFDLPVTPALVSDLNRLCRAESDSARARADRATLRLGSQAVA
jgi:hypothetical protein